MYYLTYDEFIQLGGATLAETAFDDLEFEARAIIDWWTFNRLQKEEVIPEPVKRCMYKLIALIQVQQSAMIVGGQQSESSTTTVAGIARESNDGVSTTYNTLSAKEAVDVIKTKLDATVQQYLQGVKNSLGHKLLYRGIYPDE